jgi:hypothetical protein
MPKEHRYSIQRKLTFVILTTSLLGLSLACLCSEIYERGSFRGAITSQLTALAGTLGANKRRRSHSATGNRRWTY